MPTIVLPDRSLRSVVAKAIDEQKARTIADRHGVSTNTLYSIRDGRLGKFPQPKTIKALADALGLPEAEVVLGLAAELGIDVRSTNAH